MSQTKTDKTIQRTSTPAEKETPAAKPKATAPAPFSFDADDDTPEVAVSLPVTVKDTTANIVEGIDLSGRPKIILVAGRGKTGKTTLLRWMTEKALNKDAVLAMADLDPTNASFASYFSGVQQPPNADDPALSLRWLEKFIQYALNNKVSAVIDLGGGDTTLRRLVTELPELAALVEDMGAALVMLYLIGPQEDDLSPIATMQSRGFFPPATAVIMNEAAMEPGSTKAAAFGRVLRHSVMKTALEHGAVPAFMPRLLVADAIEARRVTFGGARDGETGAGKSPLGAFDRSRVRSWLNAMDSQLAGIETWLP